MTEKILMVVVPPILAVLLDLLFGDPAWLYHPIRVVGHSISAVERLLRRLFPSTKTGERWAGILLALIIPLFFAGLSFGILFAVWNIHRYLFFLVKTFMGYQLLAARSLQRESDKVKIALEQGDLSQGRIALSYIVGRETAVLNEEQVVTAAVETIAENTSDGVIAPLFYLFLGGVPLCYFYKAVNTLDSMVGYRNETYENLGKASARLDDVLNLIPSRLAALFMLLATRVCGYNTRQAWSVYRRDRKNHASPNSAQTEAVCAGALGLQLGGGGTYSGVWKPKPTIGDAKKSAEPTDIGRANRLLLVTTVVAAIILGGMTLLILLLWR